MKVTLKVADRIIIPLALRYLSNGGYAKFGCSQPSPTSVPPTLRP